MEPNYTVKDYVAFIKQHMKVIIFTILLSLGLFIIWNIWNKNNEKLPTEQEDMIVDEFNMEEINSYLESEYSLLTPNQQATLIAYLNQDAYYFRYYIENNESSPYTHFRTIKEFLTTDEMSDYIEEVANAEFKPDSKRGVRLGFDGATNIHTFLVGVGDESENKRIAEAYYDLINEGNLSLFENKKIVFIDNEPLPYEDKLIDETDEVDPIDAGRNSGSVIVMGAIISIGAALLGIIIAFIANVFSKKISYLYNYSIADNQTLIKIREKDNEKVEKELQLAISNSSFDTTLVLAEELYNEPDLSSLENSLALSNKQYLFSTSLLDVPTNISFEEIYILTKINETSKEWFKKQLELSSLSEKPVKIIQIGS